MSYVVLARRYRPQTFEDLVGQEHVTHTLRNALLQKRTAHAYLFTGPRGVGKTSAARILARALRCLELLPNGDPCNKCEACQSSLDGNSLDIQEIDAASNTGVDNIRDLRENVEYMATAGKYRVYIIDEVHMLSTAAFNALLKTLEEPPPHVVFIFATTELHKVLPTILSRCQRFDFKKISAQVMREKLEQICKAEKITIDDLSLRTLVTESEGCMRDAESLLDQASALCGQEITHLKLESMLSLMDRNSLLELAHAFSEHSPAKALKISALLLGRGIEAKTFLSKLVDLFSDLHFYTFTGEFRNDDLEINQSLKTLKEAWSVDEVVRALDSTLKVQSQLNLSLNAGLTVESLIAKLCIQRPILNNAALVEVPKNVAPTTNIPAHRPTAGPTIPPTQTLAATSQTPAPAGDEIVFFESFIKSSKPAWIPVLASIVSIRVESETVFVQAKNDFAGRRLSSNDGLETLKNAYKAKKAIVQLDSPSAASQVKEDPREKLMQKATMAKEHSAVKSALDIFNATITETKVLDDDNQKKGV